jgi:hypothetical protein
MTLVVNDVPNIAAFERELEPTLCGHKDNPWPERSQHILDLIELDTQMTAPWIEVCKRLVTYFQTYGKVYGGELKGCGIPLLVFFLCLVPAIVGSALKQPTIGGIITAVQMFVGLILIMRIVWLRRKSKKAMESIKAEHARLLSQQNTRDRLVLVRVNGGGVAGVVAF